MTRSLEVLRNALCDNLAMSRTAQCACGRVRVTVQSEPMFTVACHCDFCQKRTGSPFEVAACWPVTEEIEVTGETKIYNGLATDGARSANGDSIDYHFCPTCGSSLYYYVDGEFPLLGIAVGNFVDPAFPAPTMEFNVKLRHSWVQPIPGAQQFDTFPQP